MLLFSASFFMATSSVSHFLTLDPSPSPVGLVPCRPAASLALASSWILGPYSRRRKYLYLDGSKWLRPSPSNTGFFSRSPRYPVEPLFLHLQNEDPQGSSLPVTSSFTSLGPFSLECTRQSPSLFILHVTARVASPGLRTVSWLVFLPLIFPPFQSLPQTTARLSFLERPSSHHFLSPQPICLCHMKVKF